MYIIQNFWKRDNNSVFFYGPIKDIEQVEEKSVTFEFS